MISSRLGIFKINSFFFFIFLYFFQLTQICCGKESDIPTSFPTLSDGFIITMGLNNYNVSDPNGESIEFSYSIQAPSSGQIQIVNIPVDAYFVVVQVHSYLQNLTLSYDKLPNRTNSVIGTNVGLVKIKDSPELRFYLSINNATEKVPIMVVAQAYSDRAPVPGGCNMEFQIEVSPFLKTSYNNEVIEVDFAPASPPSLIALLGIPKEHSCDLKPSPVTHEMYRMYLPEREFSVETYFSALSSMMTRGKILKNGVLLHDKPGSSPTRNLFAAYPSTGTVFVVIAETLTDTSVYVPSITYACNPAEENNTCLVLNTMFSKVLCAVIFFLGLFACFAGHRFFKVEMFLLGFLAGALIFYIFLFPVMEPFATLVMAVIGGVMLGNFVLITWCCCGIPLLSVILATIMFGFLITAIIFFSLTDAVDILISDINYWSLFCGIIILLSILMVSLSEKANIITCGVVGSYAAIVPVDYYIGSNLRYIVINTIRRATNSQFKYAVIDPPFEIRDLTLVLIWTTLSLTGICVQLTLVRGKAPFPFPDNIIKRLYNRLRGPSVPDERTALLLPSA